MLVTFQYQSDTIRHCSSDADGGPVMVVELHWASTQSGIGTLEVVEIAGRLAATLVIRRSPRLLRLVGPPSDWSRSPLPPRLLGPVLWATAETVNRTRCRSSP